MRGGIFGREAELGVLDAFLAGLPSAPGALVLAGTAGAGKTTLLRAGLEEIASLGYTTLRTLPSQSDMRLAFAGLADLLGPRLDAVLAGLPPPQRHALGVALLIEEAPPAPPEPRVIAAAFRTALPAPATLAGLVGERLRELPAPVARALEPVAIMPGAPLDRYLAAGVAGDDLDAAVVAGVLEADAGRLRFSHPLLASAVLGAIPHG